MMVKKSFQEKSMQIVFLLASLSFILAILLICIFLFGNGIPSMLEIGVFNFIFGTNWSPSNTPSSFQILPMILGSIYVTLLAVSIGVPIGILTAVYLAKMCSNKVYKVLKPSIELLAGIPSVVYGFFGLMVIVPLVRNYLGGSGYSILTAGIMLAIMILPTVIGISEASIKAIPNLYYEGALALGASHERSIFFVVLPAAKSGILAAIVLGIGRAIGETMAIIMVAGNQARMPNGLLGGVRTLTANIAIEMGYATNLHRGALVATGVILFIFILIINLCFSLLKRGND